MRAFILSKTAFLMTIVALFFIAWHLQSQYVLNNDTGWLLLAAKRLLAGGNYQHDFFEINPPLILYLYVPAVWLSLLTHLPIDLSVRIYVLLLVAISLMFSAGLIDRVFRQHNKDIIKPLIFSMACLLLIAPMNGFSQREHLTIILTMPYFLLVGYRLQNKTAYPLSKAIMIGLLAGLGFGIKPYFLLPLFFIEIYYCVRNKSLLRFMRPETLSVIATLIIYCFIIYFRHEDYLKSVLPAAVTFYNEHVGATYSVMFNYFRMFAPCVALLLFISYYNENRYREFSHILALAVVGFFLGYALQHTALGYHLFPTMIYSLFLTVMLFLLLTSEASLTPMTYVKLTLSAIILILTLCYKMKTAWISVYFYYVPFLIFFTLILGWLLYRAYQFQQPLKALYATLIIMIATALYGYIGTTGFRFNHIFIETLIFMTLMYVVFLPKEHRAYLKYIYFFMVGIAIFAANGYSMAIAYNAAVQLNTLHLVLKANLKPYQQQSLFFITTYELYPPLIPETYDHFASRFGSLMWVPKITGPYSKSKYQTIYLQQQPLMNNFIGMFTNDLIKFKPSFVFVDTQSSPSTDVLKFLLINPSFKEAWSHYHYLTQFTAKPYYQFDVYSDL